MEVDLEYFQSNFEHLTIRIVKIERHFINKYVLLSVDDKDILDSSALQKSYSDLKRFYSKVQKDYKNFEIGKDHQANIDRILQLGKTNFKTGGMSILKRVYTFLFKTKHYSKFKEKDMDDVAKSEDSHIAPEGKYQDWFYLFFLTKIVFTRKGFITKF